MAKKSIYLDQNFWIGLAESDMGKGRGAFPDLLKAMRLKRSALFCPVSAVHLFELHKIVDETIRASRAKLMDEFSDGLCALPWFDILDLQIENAAVDFLQMPAAQKTDIKRVIFKPLRFALGEFSTDYGSMAGEFPVAELAAYQKECEEGLKRITFTDIATETFSLPAHDELRADNKKWADSQNAEKDARAAAKSKYSRSAEWERNHRELCKDLLALITESIKGLRAKGFPFGDNISEFVKSSYFKEIPFMFNVASWLTAEMADTGIRFEENDYEDWQHICAALPYSDAFVTEKHAHNVTTQILKLDQRYGTTILKDPVDLLNTVMGL
ncbi:MAG: hypothetical protein Q8T11_03175 [Elusimicrobiota bacterium]|nr:hypothetical protein [Elusimicrobiota bacterium]